MSRRPDLCAHEWTAWRHKDCGVFRQCRRCLVKETSDFYRCELAGHLFDPCIVCGLVREPDIKALSIKAAESPDMR